MARQDANYYEQRPTRETYADESKRRKMIRWIKKTMGIQNDNHATERRGASPTVPSPHVGVAQGSVGSRTPSRGSGHSYERGRNSPMHSLNHTNTKPSVTDTSTSSFAASSGMTTSGASMDMPSVYEYHHQRPSQRPPRVNPYNRHNYRPHVLIIGGGIGGLCLAQGLKKHGIPFTVFERDPTPNYRTQGYRLRINSSGYQALKANLSRENFEVFLQSTGHLLPGFMYVDGETGGAAPDGVKFAHRTSVTQHVFSTDRAMLRSLLLTDLVEGSEIIFGMGFKKYEILSNGRVQVEFENGQVYQGSVLVGADGTTSRVRRQYIPHHIALLDTDSGAIYGKTPITPAIEQYFGTASTTMVTSQHPKMSVVIEPRCGTKTHTLEFIMSNGGPSNPANTELPDLQNYLCWALLARTSAFECNNTSFQDLYSMAPEEVADLSMRMTSNWCPRVRTLFEHQDPEWASFLRVTTMSPEIKAWQPSCVTLLGDAVHTMTPAGIGCNTAMQDARILTNLFVEHGVTVDAIAQYERAMREHGREGIAISLDASRGMFGAPDVHHMPRILC